MKNNNNKMQIQNLVTNLYKHLNPKKFIIIMAPNILKIDDNSLYKLWYSGLPNTIKYFQRDERK